MKSRLLNEAFQYVEDKYLDMTDAIKPTGKDDGSMKKRTGKHLGRTLLIAALIAALTGTALAAVLSRINIFQQDIGEGQEPGQVIAVGFEPTDDMPVYLGDWYPEQIPDGFEQVSVSDKQGDFQTVRFKNAADEVIEFTFAKAGSGSVTILENAEEQREVSVGDVPGLYCKALDRESLFWTNEERGVGFVLQYFGTGKLDLIAIAESVSEQEDSLAVSDRTSVEMALEALGDYAPTYLPEGYFLVDTTGNVSNAEGQGDQYVWRIYSDADGWELRLNYNELPDGQEISVEDMTAVYQGSEGYTVETVEVLGFAGCTVEYSGGGMLMWIDTEQRLLFTIAAPGIPMEELIEIANSIKEVGA